MYMWLIVLASAVWVLIDAKGIGVKKGLVDGVGNIGPWGWFFVTLLLWIVGFPMYLFYRGKFKRAIEAQTETMSQPTAKDVGYATPSTTAIDDLERLATLKSKGHITDGEFDAKKKQLLGL